MSSSRRKNILYVNSVNFRQHQLKETTSRLQPYMLNQALLTYTDVALTDHQTSLLNLGSKFVPATESVALNLEYYNNEADAKSSRQNVSHILNKNR